MPGALIGKKITPPGLRCDGGSSGKGSSTGSGCGSYNGSGSGNNCGSGIYSGGGCVSGMRRDIVDEKRIQQCTNYEQHLAIVFAIAYYCFIYVLFEA